MVTIVMTFGAYKVVVVVVVVLENIGPESCGVEMMKVR